MTLYNDLQQVTSDAEQSVAALNQVIDLLAAGLPTNSLLPGAGNQDTVVISHAPDGAVIYTVRQTTPNTSDGKYQGMYRLPLASSEGKLVLVAPPVFADLIEIGGNFSVPGYPNFRYTELTLHGIGANPFGSNHC